MAPHHKMRITFVLPVYGLTPVGGFRVIYEYANLLAQQGHDVTLAHASFPFTKETVRSNPYSLVRPLLETWRGKPAAPSWHALHARVNVIYEPWLRARHLPDADYVVATSWETAYLVSRLPPAKGEGLYFIQHYETWSGDKEYVDATWQLPLRKIVVSRWLSHVGKSIGAGNTSFVPNAIRHDTFYARRPIPGRPPLVAMMYSSKPWKGFSEGLAALARARAELPGLRAVVFGADPRPQLPLWVEYVQGADDETLAERVYSECAVYLCSSWNEGWGLPAAEAMACGCALVTTDNGGVGDFAVHGKTALVVPPRDVDAMAGAVSRLIQDEALRTRLAEQGQYAIRGFTWDQSLLAFERILVDSPSRRNR